jgi:hypothetical protein
MDTLRLLADDNAAKRDQDLYVSHASALLHRLDPKDPKLLKAITDIQSNILVNPRIDTLYETATFQVVSIVFDKNQEITHHDHPDMAGVLTCASGHLSIWNYECLKKQAVGARRLLRETRFCQLLPGDVSSLTAQRSNIHRLKAHDRTQLVDVFTPAYDADRRQRTQWYAVEPMPIDAKGQVFRATTLT